MDSTTQAQPLEAQTTGVPVDHRDPNHPHFPGDLEAQPSARPCLNSKSRLIIGGVIVIILSLITAVLVGGKIGMDMATRPTRPVFTTVPIEHETKNITTIEYSTSVMQLSITPDPTTITTTSMSMMPSMALLPTSTPTPKPSPTSEAPKEPTSTPRRGKGGGRQCYIVGNWPTNAECVKRCTKQELDLKEDRTATCQVDPKAVFSCVVCKA
ncbi:hypothetical protein HBI56_055390 [Parastagonospora nodorum]|nr:hypothetical protein HBH53_148380 [Parastagonospora nodorum]KAH3967069.1 hypothetical protein HBH51_139790 [Parastagonospora nodorum]KAH4003055.1 hypothetical protein HBI10_068370 [Parastagonospora nodorum]KAH4028062.1 hypothetical protein HBI13_049650 [Parastagonospora nodorum]KAH4070122.1 hypothetical protein HBH50_094320 [Parastagonospora nodorum]